MISGADLSSRFTLDAQGLNQLKLDAKQSSPEALKQAAQQFEAVFMNMLMKSMREAAPQEGLFESEQTKLFTSMLDQQLSQKMAGSRSIGLADLMVKQLSRHTGVDNATPVNTKEKGAEVAALVPTTLAKSALVQAAMTKTAGAVPSAYSENTQQDFVQRMLPHATIASRETGLPAHQMIGQAALESGWGRREILMADGSNSFNLFGIKAGASWTGKVAQVKTTEYHQGVASKPLEKFRAYDSYADSFRDYAKLMNDNPRYAKVLEQGETAQGFARALQQAGYATDPKYAEKLVQVIGRVNTLV